MSGPPLFESTEEYRARRTNADFWRSHIVGILGRHGLRMDARDPVAGFNPTYPTFVCGDVVVKLFGHVPAWSAMHVAEHAALNRLAQDPEILAPRIVGEGRLFGDEEASWPYLVTTRVDGTSWRDAGLSKEQLRFVAAQLGEQVGRIHALPTDGAATYDAQSLDVTAAAARSSLPRHLVAQVDGFLARLGPPDPVFVHGDLCGMHPFVRDGRLIGIIDWGDALVADRHYELIQIHRDAFDCDKELLRVFLDASAWPVDDSFAYKALALALHRQATGLIQHLGMDVFEPVAQRLPLAGIGTLDELAQELFGVYAHDAAALQTRGSWNACSLSGLRTA